MQRAEIRRETLRQDAPTRRRVLEPHLRLVRGRRARVVARVVARLGHVHQRDPAERARGRCQVERRDRAPASRRDAIVILVEAVLVDVPASVRSPGDAGARPRVVRRGRVQRNGGQMIDAADGHVPDVRDAGRARGDGPPHGEPV